MDTHIVLGAVTIALGIDFEVEYKFGGKMRILDGST